VQSGIEKLVNLRVLYISNNKISSWAEVDKLAVLDKLEDLLLAGNPLYNDYKENNATSEYRIEVSRGRDIDGCFC
jgi:dynein light chain 1